MRGRGLFARRRGSGTATGPGRDRPAAVPTASTEPGGGTEEGFLVEDHDGMLLLRTFSDETLTPADVADLARTMRADEDTVTVVAGAEGAGSAAFWPKLSELLDTLGESGADSVRLVMPGAGHETEGRPATARRIADAWRMAVEAPDGPPLVVPGGSLFVPPAEGVAPRPSAGGWWRFAPGERPKPLGPRSPQPSWQSALNGLPSALAGGCVVEQIPAGVLVRPSGAAPARPGDLYHAVPVDPRRLTVVVGVPFGEDISAEEVAEVLEALPDDVQVAVRLVPGGRRDLLPLAQSVSDRLDIEVEVMTGLPLVAASGPLGTYSVRSVLATPDGVPTWIPFVDAVRCAPPDAEGRARPPRLLRWSPPLPGPARPEEGVVGLTDDWQLTVTRAGMWVGPRGGPALSARRVDPGGPVIELGVPGELLDSSLWPVLSNVLESLAPDLRGRTTLHVHGAARDGGRELRRLAAQYGLRTLRHAAPAPVRAGQAAPGRPAAAAAGPAAPSGAPAPASLSPTPPVRGTARPAPSGSAERPGQGPRTQSAQPATAAHQPGRTSGSTPAPAAKIGGREARTDRARQLRESMAAGSETSAGAGTAAQASTATGAGASSTPRTPATPSTPATPRTPATPSTSSASGTSNASGTSGVSGRGPVRGERERRASTFDWSDDDRVPTGFAGRARTPATTSGPDARPEAADDTGTTAGKATTSEGTGVTEGDAPDAPIAPEAENAAEEKKAPAGAGDPKPPSAAPDAPATEPEAEAGPEAAPGRGPEADPDPKPSAGPEDPTEIPPAAPRPTGTDAREPEPAPSPPGPARRPAAESSDPAPATAPVTSTASSDSGAARVPDVTPVADAPDADVPDAPDPRGVPGAADTGHATDDGDGNDGGEGAGDEDAEPVAQEPLPPVLLDPGHRSSEAERTAFRTLAGDLWDRHGAAVARALARMPALRGKEQEAARADLIALRMYLHLAEGPLSHDALTWSLRDRELDLLPYGACVASALNRMPSFRGAVLRGTTVSAGADRPAPPRPGTLLRDAALLSTVRPDAGAAPPPGDSYVIWSVAGRRVRQFSEQRGPEEVVFAPGTLFRVLAVRRARPGVQIHLRELTGPAEAVAPDPEGDRTVLARLEAVAPGPDATPGSAGPWPDRCTGAVGAGP
ncbi:hypothetical protein ABZ895_03685 [Streptomyces californicus]|uniref:hypothetical protein n=1 Tax=Streptomyces californicus TaxID=67351 RepID=UPI0033EF211B